jgi:hypothetical protein
MTVDIEELIMRDAPSYYEYQEGKTAARPAQELDLVEIDGILVSEEEPESDAMDEGWPSPSQRAYRRTKEARGWLKAMEAGVD